MANPPAPSPKNPSSAEDALSIHHAASVHNEPPAALRDRPRMFETARLRLRPWRDTDEPGPGQGPDRDSVRFMPAGAQPGPDDFPQWLARRRRDMDTGQDLHWCIADVSTDAMLGNVQIFRMGPAQDRFQGELGYWLRPGARGRGVIGEALRPVISHAFTPVTSGGLGLIRLHAATDSDNYVSQSILRSAGFTQWGADHLAFRRTDGTLSDGVYFELLASALEPATPEPTTLEPTTPEPTTLELTALEPISLKGRGVRLRAWRNTDAPRVVQACSDQLTRHWLAHSLPSPYTLEHAHSFIAGRTEEAQRGLSLSWCVADPENDECLGALTISDLHDALGTSGEIGYWAHPDARGRGVMSEAVRLAVRHAFIPRQDGGLGRRRLQLGVADGNSASAHIALANGFVEVGRDRQAEPLGDGTFADLMRFDLLVDEWTSGL